MDIKKLQSVVVDALEDVKAQEIRVFDTVHLTSLFDRIAIASGTSNRQTKALAASVRDKVKENGGQIVSIEGEDTGEWVLVDLGDMIVHIMQPAIREYYRLEEIWGEKEVKMGAAKRTSTATRRSASPSTEDDAPRKTSRHLTASRAADDDTPRKAAARKSAAGKTATPAAKKTSRTTPATVAGKSKETKPPARKTPAKKAVGKTIKVAASKSATTAKKSAKTAAKTATKRAPSKSRSS
jgi:ribosome-associated protein